MLVLLLMLCSPAMSTDAPVGSLRPSSWVPPSEGLLPADGRGPIHLDGSLEDLTSLLQLKVSMHRNSTLNVEADEALYMRRGGPGSPTQCGQRHPEDLYRPVAEVLAEHPGVDANCYFQFAAFWLAYAPHKDYLALARAAVVTMRSNPLTCQFWRGHGSGPKATAHFELGTVTSHLDCTYYTYDDLYFYSLGWLKNQRLNGSLMTSPEAWRVLAAEECAKIQAEYQFTPEETTVGKHVDDNPGISMHSMCAWQSFSPCKRVTVREFKLHIYTKCLMGHAAEEMAYAHMRACLLPGNVIGHGDACGTCPDGKVCP